MDYIIKPCDWETIYLDEEQDPNKFGEALREYCFVGGCMERGCYTTFDLIKELKEIKSGKIYDEVKKEISPEFEQSLKVYYNNVTKEDLLLEYTYPNGKQATVQWGETYELIVGWEWCGDGTLYFRWNNRKVINTDCKNDYEWEWVN